MKSGFWEVKRSPGSFIAYTHLEDRNRDVCVSPEAGKVLGWFSFPKMTTWLLPHCIPVLQGKSALLPTPQLIFLLYFALSSDILYIDLLNCQISVFPAPLECKLCEGKDPVCTSGLGVYEFLVVSGTQSMWNWIKELEVYFLKYDLIKRGFHFVLKSWATWGIKLHLLFLFRGDF